jgi:hypothetical protein
MPLEDFIDRRVTLSGVLDKFGKAGPSRQYDTALIQDVIVDADGEQIDIGHTWLQVRSLDEFGDIELGDRFSCLVRPTKYQDKAGDDRIGFRFPTEFKLVNRPAAIRIPQPRAVIANGSAVEPEMNWSETDTAGTAAGPPPEPEPVETLSPVEAIRRLRALAKSLGGMDKLLELAREL